MGLVDYSSDESTDGEEEGKRRGDGEVEGEVYPKVKRLRGDVGVVRAGDGDGDGGETRRTPVGLDEQTKTDIPMEANEKEDDKIHRHDTTTTTIATNISIPQSAHRSIPRSIHHGSSSLGGGLKTKYFDGEINAPESIGISSNHEIKPVEMIPASMAARIAKYGSNGVGMKKKKQVDASIVYAKSLANGELANDGISMNKRTIDLFSIGDGRNDRKTAKPDGLSTELNESTEYKPILVTNQEEEEDSAGAGYGPGSYGDHDEAQIEESHESDESHTNQLHTNSTNTVNLSSFIPGKRHQNKNIQVVDFDAEKFYKENEHLRSTGQLEDLKRPVKAVGSGKHQLSTLLRSAQANREGLEEMFAQGKRNKREMGKR